MTCIVPCLFFLLTISGCGSSHVFHLVKTDNPEFIANSRFIYYKDSTYPYFRSFKEKYRLDTAIGGETDEFRKILLLRNWIKRNVPLTPDGIVRHSGEPTAENILDQALKGNGYYCSYFMVVHSEVMNAAGIVSRVINADEGELNLPGQVAHHGTNEVWSNTFHKWFFSDAMFDIHFEKNGIPLSALEIRDEYFKNKAADILMVYGPDRVPIDFYPDKTCRSKEHFARVFTWIAWFRQSDVYSNWDNGISYLMMFEDDYAKSHKWIRVDGKPHWAYNTEYLEPIKNRNELYWTPNTIISKVKIDGNAASIELHSSTPYLRSYQMSNHFDTTWRDTPAVIHTSLHEGRNELVFRAMNREGIAGPEHRIIIE